MDARTLDEKIAIRNAVGLSPGERQEECSLAMFNQTLFGLVYEDPSRIEAAVLRGR